MEVSYVSYIRAMASLYGIISVNNAWDIISSYEPKAKRKEFEKALIAIMLRGEYADLVDPNDLSLKNVTCNQLTECEIVDRRIADRMRFINDGCSAFYVDKDNVEIYRKTKSLQGDKPFYIPKVKEELLRYKNSLYQEKTPELLDFLYILIELDLIMEFSLFMREMTTFSVTSKKVLALFDSQFIKSVMPGEKRKQFCNAYDATYSVVRTVRNRGFSDKEIEEMEKQKPFHAL